MLATRVDRVNSTGKGRARVKLRRLLTALKTLKSAGRFARRGRDEWGLTPVQRRWFWHFMNNEPSVALSADAKAIGDSKMAVVGWAECIVTLWNGRLSAITPPNFVERWKCGTDQSEGRAPRCSGKPATLSACGVVKVPLFVRIGESDRSRYPFSGEYVSA